MNAIIEITYLNTSHVKVQSDTAEFLSTGYLFKYISC